MIIKINATKAFKILKLLGQWNIISNHNITGITTYYGRATAYLPLMPDVNLPVYLFITNYDSVNATK